MNELKVELGFKKYPPRHTCEGEGISPRIMISGLTTPLMAMVLDDPDCPGGTYTHWTIWNIKGASIIPEGVSVGDRPPELPGSSQGSNSDREVGYIGPCPPRGTTHRYFLKVYGLNGPLQLPPGARRIDVDKALQGSVVQYGEAMATYCRD
jgi:Raf kinase inhibitor-like YbhB/YbcL family protein